MSGPTPLDRRFAANLENLLTGIPPSIPPELVLEHLLTEGGPRITPAALAAELSARLRSLAGLDDGHRTASEESVALRKYRSSRRWQTPEYWTRRRRQLLARQLVMLVERIVLWRITRPRCPFCGQIKDS